MLPAPSRRSTSSIGIMPSISQDFSSRTTASGASSFAASGSSPAIAVRMSTGVTTPSIEPCSSTITAKWIFDSRNSSSRRRMRVDSCTINGARTRAVSSPELASPSHSASSPVITMPTSSSSWPRQTG